MTERVCLILKDTEKKTLVELPRLPETGELTTISPTEVLKGPQPEGQVITQYVPARNLIKVTQDLGMQKHFHDNYHTYVYERGGW